MGEIRAQVANNQVVLPKERWTGSELKQMASIEPGRQLVVTGRDGKSRVVADHEQVDLFDGVRVSDVPRHTYGANSVVAERLQREADYMANMYNQTVEFGFDPQLGLWWCHLPEFQLPSGWLQAATPLVVTVHDTYPSSTPEGFYLSKQLRHRNGSVPGHYFETRMREDRLTQNGWAWFCIHPNEWRPNHDLRDGDSIAKYLTLIHLALSTVISRAV